MGFSTMDHTCSNQLAKSLSLLANLIWSNIKQVVKIQFIYIQHTGRAVALNCCSGPGTATWTDAEVFFP
jgi:hypothetical protein